MGTWIDLFSEEISDMLDDLDRLSGTLSTITSDKIQGKLSDITEQLKCDIINTITGKLKEVSTNV